MSPALIGRVAELQLLTQAVTSPPAVITVCGEAGIGKSRLVAEVAKNAELLGRRVLLGRCHPLDDPFPLGPLVEALRDVEQGTLARPLTPLAGVLRPLLPELSRVLPAAPGRAVEPRLRRHLTFRALLELLRALGPAVCVLEDLHLADDETLDFASFLVSDLPKELALVLTHRTEDCPPAVPALGVAAAHHVGRTAVELSTLSVDDVGELAARLLATDALPEQFVDGLHARTDGVPLAVEEVLAEAARHGVPSALRHRVVERVARLSADARALAAAAAVVDRPTAEALLAKVAGLPAARMIDALVECLGGGLLEEHTSGVFCFRRSLTRQATYESVAAPQRRRLHVRAAHALESAEQPRDLARIAHHFRQADRTKQWTRYAEAAAAEAHVVGDDDAATELLGQALQTPGVPRTTRVRMALALGVSALYSPPASCRRAAALLERELDEDSLAAGVRGELRFSLCRLRFHAGETETWHQEMHRAVEELHRRPELATRAMVNLALPRLSDGDVVENLSWLRRAEQTADRQGDRVANIALAAQRAAILLEIGDPSAWDAAREIPTETRSVDEQLQLLRGYMSLAAAAIGTGHHRRAEDILMKSERLQADMSHEHWRVRPSSLRVCLDYATGRWEGLESRAHIAGAALVLAGLLTARGDLDEATAHVESALAGARAALSIRDVTDAGAALARLQLLRGEPDAARRTALEAVNVARHKGIWVSATAAVPEAVAALLACDRDAEAAGLVGEFAAGLRGVDAPAGMAALAWCQAALSEFEGDQAGAARTFSLAERLWRALPTPYAAAWTRARTGRCLLRGGDEQGGRLLLDALEELDGLGASHDAARIRAILRQEGVYLPYPWRGGRRAYGAELSPREIEVARLAAMGKTNREIAEVLVLSRRTVAHHVSSSLHKLKLASRTQFAGLSLESGRTQE